MKEHINRNKLRKLINAGIKDGSISVQEKEFIGVEDKSFEL